MKNRYAVYYVTPPGESDSEGLFIAKSERGAVRVFRLATGTAETDWDAHRLSPYGGRAYCNGYVRACDDIAEMKEAAARRNLVAAKELEVPRG